MNMVFVHRVGSVLVIPASVVVDWLTNHYVLPWAAILGVIVILLGFFALVFSEGFEAFHSHKNPAHQPTIPHDHAINIAPTNKQGKWSRHFTWRKLLQYII